LATDNADGEEAVTFSKRNPEEKQGEAPTTWPEKKKKKECKFCSNNLVATANKWPPSQRPISRGIIREDA
jgi:hypothetical protein